MRQIFKNILFMFLTLFIVLIILETGLRIAGVSFVRFHQMDYYTAHALRPGARGWQKDENKVYIKINSKGLRDKEHTLKKPENTLRIAVLGDSYAEAFQVPMENAFWAVAEKELNNCGVLKGKNVEFINFGVGGYGTDTELIALRRRVWQYDPDIVLLAFLTGNDIKDNYPAFNPTEMKPYFREVDGKLVPDYSFRNSERYLRNSSLPVRILEKGRNVSVILQILDRVRLARKNKAVFREFSENMSKYSEEGLNGFSMVYLEPEMKEWVEAWDITEKLIVQMDKDVEEKNAKFVVVTLTNPSQINPFEEDSRKEKEQASRGLDYEYPDKRIKKLGDEHGFPVLNLVQPFRKYGVEKGVYLHGPDNNPGSGHWNKEGHRLAGELISNFICEKIITKRSDHKNK